MEDTSANAPFQTLRYGDLNRWINAEYGRLGARFQAIIDPSFATTGVSDAYAPWFQFAAFASRGIGKAQLGAAIALDAARNYRETGDHEAALARFIPSHVAELAAGVIGALVRKEARLAGTFLVAFASTLRNQGALDGLAVSALLDPRTFVVTLERMLQIIRTAPGADPIDQLASISRTLRNAMEDGNRRIYMDVGLGGHAYLEFRATRPGVTPADVLQEFSLPGLSDPDRAKTAYEFAIAHLNDAPPPVHFERLIPGMVLDARPLVIAGFALYEQAGQTRDLEAKNRCVAFANNFLIFREQHQALQPAFTPGSVLPGEVDRLKLLAVITPMIEVELRLETWRFWEYAEKHLPSRGLHPLHSRATEYNWAVFADRWEPVIDTFGPCYRNPRAMWPAPNPDPNENL